MTEFKVTDDDMRKIAEMVVKTSLNIQKGDCIYITGQSNKGFKHIFSKSETAKFGLNQYQKHI